MRRFSIYFVAVASLIATACTNDFEDINTNPNKIEEIDPGAQFGNVQLNIAGGAHEEWRGNLIMAGPLSGVMQCGYRTGQAFETADSYSNAKWESMYKGAVKNGRDMLRVMGEDNEDGSWDAKIAETEILLQITAQRLTDLYGDIPYSEAGLGYSEGILYPKYDTQESIYKAMVEGLKANRDLLLSSDSDTFDSTEDIIYGHLASDSRAEAWARLANSMLLRIGMRASSADLTWAQEVVEEAANHSAGYINSNENTVAALIKHTDAGGAWGSHTNGSGTAINGLAGGFAYAYLGDEYVRMAQQNRDPRLFYIGAQIQIKDGEYLAWTGQTEFDPFIEAARPGEPWKAVNFAPERGGGTNSYSVRGAKTIDGSSVYTDYFVTYSSLNNDSIDFSGNKRMYDTEWAQYHTLVGINPNTVGSVVAPTIVFGAEESYFILAEAALNGWNVPGSVDSNLRTALDFAMPVYRDLYPSDGSPDVYIAKYRETTGDETSLEDMEAAYITTIMSGPITAETIWTERWKSLAINGYEAFALWNRTELSVNSTTRPYNDAVNIDLPEYTFDDMDTLELGTEIATDSYSSVPFHDGGVTAGVRPRRLDYPNSERTNNQTNIEAALGNQEQFGNAGAHYISTKMWISKR